ncbi:hypothetical protein GCM10027174_34400 [Salinifilum aidingensis]
MDILLVTFIGGFILATLIFWPLLRRSQRRSRAVQRRNRALLVQQSAAGDSTAARGRHAASEPDSSGDDGTAPEPATAPAAESHAAAAEAAAPPQVRGKHEAHTPDSPEPPSGTAATGAQLAGKRTSPEYAGSVSLGGDLGGALGNESAPEAAAGTAPEPRHGARADTSVVPTDLYERKYAWRFARSRKRLERLRTELGETRKTA